MAYAITLKMPDLIRPGEAVEVINLFGAVLMFHVKH